MFHACSDITGVRGFSRETLVALAADIETKEWRRKCLALEGFPEEHPRASTTDDVECFFSVLRDSVENDFTLKDFQKSTLVQALLMMWNTFSVCCVRV